jgi:transcription elongation GreA/GreB family factor
VTRRGLRLIESRVAGHENELALATAAADREALGRAARELRYWTARLASAEVADPDLGADHVVFGTSVTVLREDETEATFRIVGEDEADPPTGRIA